MYPVMYFNENDQFLTMKDNVDHALVELNKRYKKAVMNKNRRGWLIFLSSIINFLRRGRFSLCFQYINQSIYALTHYSTKGNVNFESPSPHLDVKDIKIAVYTCIIGNYDELIEPLFVEPGIDYFVFTDSECPETSAWKKVDITLLEDYRELTPSQLNRKIKMLSFKYLSEYDYSIYIDGNIEIVACVSPLIQEMGTHAFGVHYHYKRDCIYDEKVRVIYSRKADKEILGKQINSYKSKGFPCHFGLYENPVLIRMHHDVDTCNLMERWWQEYLKYSTRDQLSLPYVIWETGYDRRKIHIIDRSFYINPRFNKLHSHNKH